MKDKMVLYFSFLLFLFGCSSDAGDIWNYEYNSSTKTYFSPPVWIQGEWDDDNNNYNKFEFTNNDFIVRNVSYNERINFLSTKYLNCTEHKSTTNYKLTILHLSVNIDIYNFEYVSNSEVNCIYESGTEDNWDNRIIENYTLTRL